MTALPAFIFPENIWPVALTGAEFVPILAGSVYPTVITLNTLSSFLGGGAGGPFLQTTATAGTDQSITTGGAGKALRVGNGPAGLGNAFNVTTDTGANTYGAANPNTVLVNNLLTAGRYTTNTNTVTFSGGVALPAVLDITSNLAGSSSVVGGTTLFLVKFGFPSDNVNLTDPNGSIGTLGLITNHGGTVFAGNRHGLNVQMNWNTTSPGGGYLVGMGAITVSSINAGGVTGGFGTTQFGSGSMFGANAWARAATGTTFFGQIVGAEFNASIQTGSSSSRFALLQVIGTSDHAVHGANIDAGLIIGMQTGTTIGVRNTVQLGDYTSRWVSDPNGYLVQTQGNQSVANLMAGGIDFNQTTASGSGPEGGGFYWRSPGLQAKDTEVQIGYGAFKTDANGATIDATYKQMATAAGSITVAAGGANFTTGDLVVDAFGNALVVTAAAGVVTGISSVVARGWQTSAPGDPVSFTARTRIGSALGSGLTLNLGAWTAKTELFLQPSGGPVRVGSGMIIANGSVATVLGSLGPVGSHTTVQEWMQVKNAAGTVRYIPAF